MNECYSEWKLFDIWNGRKRKMKEFDENANWNDMKRWKW